MPKRVEARQEEGKSMSLPKIAEAMPKRGEAEVRKEEGRLRSRPWRGGGGGARRGEV